MAEAGAHVVALGRPVGAANVVRAEGDVAVHTGEVVDEQVPLWKHVLLAQVHPS